MNEISVDRRPGSNPRPNSLPRPAAWAIAAFVVTGSVCAPVARAQDAAADPFAPAREAITREIREEMVRCRLPGFAIAVADGGRIVWAEGFGTDLPTGGRTITADTPFRVASISKLFCATLAALAAARGTIDLDADVERYVAGIRPRGHASAAITLRHLLTHTAGVLREPPVGHYFDPTPPPLAEVAASLAGTDLVAAPGTVFKYSNAGVAWAGRILEVQAEVPFAELAAREILTPLGLRSASFVGAGRDDVAGGVMWTYDGRAIPTPSADLGLGPAANLCASMPDLARFAQTWFLGEHRVAHALLDEATLRAMFTPQLGQQRIGLGFFLDRLDGELQVGHGGAYYGASTEVSALPEHGLAVAVATTVDFASGPIDRLSAYALRCALAARQGNAMPAPPTTGLRPVGRERARALAGTYGAGVELLARGDELWLRPRAGVWLQLSATDAPDLLVAADRATGWREVRLRQGALVVDGRTLPRRPDDRPPAECPDDLLPFVGEYGWDHDVLLVFEREGGLAVLIEWLAEYPLATVDAAAGRFAFAAGRGLYAGEPVTFERDAQGRVTAAVVGAVRFPARALAGVEGGRFRVAAQYPRERLLAMAREARAPAPPPGSREFDLVELKELEPTIAYDVRYAGDDNFLGFPLYDRAEAKLQRPAAEAVVRVHRALAGRGLGLVVHDAWRPWYVTKMFWDATPPEQRHFVADPSKGSRHNRGCAIDLSLFERETGAAVSMPSLYDEFTPRAYPDYPGGTSRQRWYREVLRGAMEDAGFTVYEFEWWHFDWRDWREYPVR